MSGNLIDTNVIIKLLNGDEETIEIFASLENINVSVITAGELFYGAQKSSRKSENMKLFKDFLSEYPVVDINEIVSESYGKLKSKLVKKGINIPENDIWIAATAISYKLKLITFDEHFKSMNDLDL